MAAEWRTVSVAELQREGALLVEDGNHGEYRPRSEEFVDVGVAFVRAADMNDGIVLFDRTSKINDKARRRITKGIGAGGDVLLSHKGTVGKVALVPLDAPPFVCSPQTTFWRALNSSVIDREYLHAYLRSPGFHAQLATRAGETDMAPYVSLTAQRGLLVTLPPIDEQRNIAHVVGTFDNKIEWNRKMNETLEAMARALFKSWFVDFDPVRTRVEGRDPGLPAHIAGLFPDSFEGSEIGQIPRGWTTIPVFETAEFSNGAAYRDMHFSPGDEGLPVIKIAELKSGVTSTTRFTTTDLGEKYRIDSKEILFSWSGNPDTSINTFIWDGGSAWLNQHIFRVRENGKVSRVRLYCLLKTLRPVFAEIARNKQTTGLGHVTVADMKKLLIAQPTLEVANAFDQCVTPIFDRIIANQLEVRTLITIRDSLLPKLISGIVSVSRSQHLGEVEGVG